MDDVRLYVSKCKEMEILKKEMEDLKPTVIQFLDHQEDKSFANLRLTTVHEPSSINKDHIITCTEEFVKKNIPEYKEFAVRLCDYIYARRTITSKQRLGKEERKKYIQ
jgi:hypothetical protein